MALCVDTFLTDAYNLVVHLKDHGNMADNIIADTQTLCNKIVAMKQYRDDNTELSDIAKHRLRSTLVLGLAQENHQIRGLQQENRELQAALEEHQSALELVMQKYREHTLKLLQSNTIEKTIQERGVIERDSECHLMDKIDEMAGVMQKAIEVDERLGRADQERLSCLEVENRALREMLEICTTSNLRILSIGVKKGCEEESDSEDDKTDSESESSILVSPGTQKNEWEKESTETKMKDSAELESESNLSITSMDIDNCSNTECSMTLL